MQERLIAAKNNHDKIIYIDANQNPDVMINEIKSLSPTVKSIEHIEKKDDFFKYKITSSEDIRTIIFNECIQKKWVLRELNMEETRLEDIFIQVTKDPQ